MSTENSTALTQKLSGISINVDSWLAKDRTAAVILFAFAILIRLPFRSQFLYHWDSVNFAYAMGEFNLAHDQPQPPGYILYVFLSRLINLFFHDPQTTLVAISLVASSLAVVVLYFVAKTLFNRPTGWIAAVLLATSPLFWFYSEIALPHTLDTLLVLGCVLILYRVYQGDHRFIYPAILLLGIAGGVRQQTLVFLLPLTLFAFLRIGIRRWIMAAGLGIVVCLAWFIPLIALSGGLANYLKITNVFSERFQDTTSIFLGAGGNGVIHNLRKLVEYTLYAWGPALMAPIVYTVYLIRNHAFRPTNWGRWIFLGLWISPALIFYTIIHMGQQGLIFVYLPALLIAGAFAIERLLHRRTAYQVYSLAFLVLFNIVVFCLLPEFPFGAAGIRILNRDSIVETDRYYADRIQTVRRNFNPANTLILAVNWHHVEYYLPEYHQIAFEADVVAKELLSTPFPHPEQPRDSILQDWGLTLTQNQPVDFVIIDPVMDRFVHPSVGLDLRQVTLSKVDSISYLELPSDARIHLAPGDVEIQR